MYARTNPRIARLVAAMSIFITLVQGIQAQGIDAENHYKGLFSNHFDSAEKWSYHFQLTAIMQGHPAFPAAYNGQNSLQDTAEKALSLTSTLYLGRKLWKGAAIFFNPEIAGGKGMSYALGLAGAANGETFRVGSPAPALYVARFFIEQNIPLRNSKDEHREADLNQLADNIPESRITISAGKFSLADFFDDNSYSHDPRSEFMNWALMDNGAWDYPANTRGYTWGLVAELIKPSYSIRAAATMVPERANSMNMDLNIDKANSETIEFEKKLKIKKHPGSVRLLGYTNFSSAPAYSDALVQMQQGDSTLLRVINGKQANTSYGGLKYGAGLSFNQEITSNIGIFARVGWNDGQTATWAFTEIDQTASLGLSFTPTKIKRPDDEMGIACVVNGISASHLAYLNAGGYGFMLGDGKLPHYGYEQIGEVYYKFRLAQSFWVTADYQYIINPGYNTDRGPVNVFSVRGHLEF